MWKPSEEIGGEKKHTKTIHFFIFCAKAGTTFFCLFFFQHTIFFRDFCITLKCITQLAFPKQRYSSLFSWNSERMKRWSSSHTVLFLAILGYFLQSRNITKRCPHIWALFQTKTTGRTSLTSLVFSHFCHTKLKAFEAEMEGVRQWDCYSSKKHLPWIHLMLPKEPFSQTGCHKGLSFL